MFCFVLLLLFWLFLPLQAFAYTETAVPAAATDQAAKLQELKKINNELLLELNALEAKIEMLQLPSTELATQLHKARSELQKSQQALTNCGQELKNAKILLNETRSSLQTLKNQLAIENQQRKRTENRLRRQRYLWQFLAGGLLVYAAAK